MALKGAATALLALTIGLTGQAGRADIVLPETDFVMNLRNFHMSATYDRQGNKVRDAVGAQPGEDAWGIYKVTSITDAGANVLWADGDGGREVAGVFYGIQDMAVTYDHIDAEWTILSTNMTLDLWDNPHGSLDATLGSAGRIGAAGYAGITDVGGTMILRALSRVGGPGFGLPELDTVVNAPGYGDLRAWADVIGGTQQADFDTDSQLGGTDLYLSADIFPGTVADWQCGSSDPIAGRFIPEPCTIAVLAGGMVALLSRRKRS
ncbi:MAG: PEP-CTERM sorting domain-containing protein [Planctomycetota bacterium]|jgi:hypothetical protein